MESAWAHKLRMCAWEWVHETTKDRVEVIISGTAIWDILECSLRLALSILHVNCRDCILEHWVHFKAGNLSGHPGWSKLKWHQEIFWEARQPVWYWSHCSTKVNLSKKYGANTMCPKCPLTNPSSWEKWTETKWF